MLKRFDAMLAPPFLLVTRVVERVMVGEAERHGPFVAHFLPERPRLREGQAMRVRRPLPPADQAGLPRDVAAMALVPDTAHPIEPGRYVIGVRRLARLRCSRPQLLHLRH